MHAMDATGRRAAAMESVPRTIEANQALQARIDALGAPLESPRLSALEAHDLNLGTPKPPPTLGQKVKAAGAAAAVYGAANILLPGFAHFAAAPLAAAAGAKVMGEKLGGTLAKVTAAARARQLKAVDALMVANRAVRKVAPPLASKVLAAVRFAPEAPPDRHAPAQQSATTLVDTFHARASEMAQITAPGPLGKPVIRPHVREQIAANLHPIAATAPHLADRMETAAVRRVEFLAEKMPRTTQLGMTRIPPSEMAIRAWARTIAAADDPGAVLDRVADGSITPEDAMVMRELYPDMLAEFTRQVTERLPTLRATLSYRSRISLSILTGAPVDASMEPHILARLQGIYVTEPGSEGGTQAPRPRPAFGSVKKPEPTPAQSRASAA
jgi:hypothetical protein